MKTNFSLKDLTDISEKIDICTVANKYVVSAYTNALEGEVNAYIKIDSCEDGSLGRSVLFSIRNGEQICCHALNVDEELLRIPDDYLARIKESLSVGFSICGQEITVWRQTIDKINAKHLNDKNKNYSKLGYDLPVPDFKYVIPESKKHENILDKVINKLFKREAK